jgi:hypothetical protein
LELIAYLNSGNPAAKPTARNDNVPIVWSRKSFFMFLKDKSSLREKVWTPIVWGKSFVHEKKG